MKRKLLLLVLILMLTGNAFGALTALVTTDPILYDEFDRVGIYHVTLSGDLEMGPFPTFCLEMDEPLYPDFTTPPIPLDARIQLNAVSGGVGILGDPLGSEAAWLYAGFLNGSIPVGDMTDVRLMQEAIWYFEEEPLAVIPTIASNKYLAMVDSAGPLSGLYGIRVLHLNEGKLGSVQDVLVPIPTPSAIVLGALGVGFVGWIRKKRVI
jgi:hypothetical protein